MQGYMAVGKSIAIPIYEVVKGLYQLEGQINHIMANELTADVITSIAHTTSKLYDNVYLNKTTVSPKGLFQFVNIHPHVDEKTSQYYTASPDGHKYGEWKGLYQQTGPDGYYIYEDDIKPLNRDMIQITECRLTKCNKTNGTWHPIKGAGVVFEQTDNWRITQEKKQKGTEWGRFIICRTNKSN